MTCKFVKAWIGDCNAPTEQGQEYCEIHSKMVCAVCGKQATHDCAETYQFVCGIPLCDECVCPCLKHARMRSGLERAHAANMQFTSIAPGWAERLKPLSESASIEKLINSWVEDGDMGGVKIVIVVDQVQTITIDIDESQAKSIRDGIDKVLMRKDQERKE